MTKDQKAKLLIKSKRKLFLNTSGDHLSLFSGDGLDFKEIREYSSGDDIRHINWKVTARKRATNVNVFNEDKQINIVLVYLNSASTYFGSIKSKQDTMIESMVTLAQTALRKNDLVTSIFFSSNEEKYYKATKTNKIVDININTAYNLDVLGKNIDYEKLEHYILGKIKKKSLIFFIGDFLSLPKFKSIAKKHEVYCAIVRDKLEEDLSLYGEFNFVNTSTFDEQNILIDEKASALYKQKMKEYDTSLFLYLKSLRIKYQKIYTNENLLKQLYKLVKV